MSIQYDKYLKTPHWKKKRIECYQYFKGMCFDCNKSVYNKSFHVHHLNYKHFYSEKILRDVILLCPKCHKERHPVRTKKKDVVDLKTFIFKNKSNTSINNLFLCYTETDYYKRFIRNYISKRKNCTVCGCNLQSKGKVIHNEYNLFKEKYKYLELCCIKCYRKYYDKDKEYEKLEKIFNTIKEKYGIKYNKNSKVINDETAAEKRLTFKQAREKELKIHNSKKRIKL